MEMARSSSGLYRSNSGTGFGKGCVSVCWNQGPTDGVNLPEAILDQNEIAVLPTFPNPSYDSLTSWQCEDAEEIPHEDCDFGVEALKYVTQILMEEDIEENNGMFKESLALEATEKLFYDVIGQKHPNQMPSCIKKIRGNPCEVPASPSSIDSSSSASGVPTIFNHSESILQFRRGLEEARRFLPNGNDWLVDLGNHRTEDPHKVEKRHGDEYFRDGWRRKNPHPGGLDPGEERRSKQAYVCNEMTVTSEMFNQVLLFDAEEREAALRWTCQNEKRKTLQQDGQSKGAGKSHNRKRTGKMELVDLRSLLTLCAEAVAADNRTDAERKLREIRQHASPMGDGMQRLAHYFANALEARLACSGFRMYKTITVKPSAANYLRVYHLLLAVTPFMKVTNFVSNRIIAKAAEKSGKLHVIDFGILYGFAWPSLIQRLSSRPGGPPRLRITGIDLPRPGFKPAETTEEAGRLLANYAKIFNIPFEFNPLVQKLETLQIEDLKIEEDEVLVVRSRYRFRNLLDESVMVESPRNTVLNLIRKMNPHVFIHGIVNAASDAPFFLIRFREALHHFCALFDMLEHTVPRNILERMLIEREIQGREIMNIIACEGLERIERPETYRQWQARHERAGFRQLPLDQELVKVAKERVKSCYHKDFMIDEDGQWLRLGWKGRVLYAISCWKPA